MKKRCVGLKGGKEVLSERGEGERVEGKNRSSKLRI